jgi:hypothetical protein
LLITFSRELPESVGDGGFEEGSEFDVSVVCSGGVGSGVGSGAGSGAGGGVGYGVGAGEGSGVDAGGGGVVGGDVGDGEGVRGVTGGGIGLVAFVHLPMFILTIFYPHWTVAVSRTPPVLQNSE